MTKRKILTSILTVITLLVAFFAWFSLWRAVTVTEASTWALPMSLFSTYAIFICLDIVFFKESVLLELVLGSSLLISIAFAFDVYQIVAVALGIYLLHAASRRIRRDMDLNMEISIWKSLQTGRSYLLMSLALVISMQYFVTISKFDGQKSVPNFDMTSFSKGVVMPILANISPQFKSLNDESLTVDQFILQNQAQFSDEQQIDEQFLESQLPQNLTPAQKEELKRQAQRNFSDAKDSMSKKNQELILSVGRKQLSDMIGQPVNGNEKISDIFAGLVNKKLNDYFRSPINGEGKTSAFPLILAVILFLTIYPIGGVLSMAWFLIVKLIFKVLVKLSVINIKRIPVEKEIME